MSEKENDKDRDEDMEDDELPDDVDAPPYEGKTALVVDDDRVARRVHSKMLEKLGFEVTMAPEAKSGLKITAEQKFDLVLSDLSMPGMSGIDFLREARARGLKCPFLILTATGTLPKAVEAIKLGAFEFLEKPMKQEALAAVIGDAMVSCKPSASMEQTSDALSLKIDVTEPATAQKPPPPDVVRDAAVIGPHQDDHVPEKLGRYEVLSVIGKGGMGTVFKCYDPMLKRDVAVKVLHLVDDVPEHQQELIDRFKREAAAAATLTHPNIVGVYDMGQDKNSGAWFIVMELLHGRGLHVVMDDKQVLFETEAVTLGFHMADALAHAHAAGVVHRDIKPSNILIQADGSAKLVDFGLAAMRGWKVTVDGRIFGSPSYMSPERIKGEPGTALSDQFSLGTVLYECMAGDNPFDGDTLETKVLRLLQHDPPPIGDFIPTVPEKLSNTLTRMLSKNEGDRFPKMEDVVEQLREVGRVFDLDLKPYKPPTEAEE